MEGASGTPSASRRQFLHIFSTNAHHVSVCILYIRANTPTLTHPISLVKESFILEQLNELRAQDDPMKDQLLVSLRLVPLRPTSGAPLVWTGGGSVRESVGHPRASAVAGKETRVDPASLHGCVRVGTGIGRGGWKGTDWRDHI